MINLLPPEQNEELLKEERFKLTLILGIVWVALLVSFFLILFSIKIFLSNQLEIQKIILIEKEKTLEISQVEELEKKIKEHNLNFSKLNSFYQNRININQVLEKISRALPSQTYLTNFNFSLNKISLSGFSPDREKLLEFKENLEKEKNFKEIYFPPSNWLEQTDISFTVNFVYEL